MGEGRRKAERTEENKIQIKEGNMENPKNLKTCPFMSTATGLVYCSTECKLNSHSPLKECVFEIIAKSLIVTETNVNDINSEVFALRRGQ
jgi:hypothetical protein